MDFLSWELFSYFLELNLLICFFAVILWGLLFLKKHDLFKVKYRDLLRSSYFVLIFILLLPLVRVSPSSEKFLKPLVVEYSGTSRSDFINSSVGQKTYKVIEVMSGPERGEGVVWFISNFDLIFCLISLIALLICFMSYLKTRKKINTLLATSFSLRSRRRTRVMASDHIVSPFSVKMNGLKYVFVPNSMLGNAEYLRMSILHEFQHHRQGDTQIALLLEFFKFVFFYNPFSWMLLNLIDKLTEFSCDEVLLGHKGFSFEEYGNCLIAVAETINKSNQSMVYEKLVGTANLSSSAKFLKRRILAMKQKKGFSKFQGTLALLMTTLLFCSVSYGAKSITKSHRISMNKAMELAEETQRKSQVPIFVNQEVLKFLNLGLGTERGRMYVKATLKRMKKYRPMIENHLQTWNLPEELLAVPAHESGYQNYDNGIGRGIWSFTPGTARAFGLQVNDLVDEREDEQKLTIAALKYYSHLIKIKEFKGNWLLAILAYNSGQNRLRESIAEVGSTDIQDIIKKSTNLKRENIDYIPRLMAWLIIIKNPHLLD